MKAIFVLQFVYWKATHYVLLYKLYFLFVDCSKLLL